MRIKSSFEEDFKKRSNAWLWRNVSHRATTDDTKQAHANSCLSSTLIFVPSRAKTNVIQTVVSQLSHKLLSINSHTNSCLSTLLYLFHNEQIESKQLSYNIFVSTTLLSIFVSSRARWVKTNSSPSTLIQVRNNSCHARLWCESKHMMN